MSLGDCICAFSGEFYSPTLSRSERKIATFISDLNESCLLSCEPEINRRATYFSHISWEQRVSPTWGLSLASRWNHVPISHWLIEIIEIVVERDYYATEWWYHAATGWWIPLSHWLVETTKPQTSGDHYVTGWWKLLNYWLMDSTKPLAGSIPLSHWLVDITKPLAGGYH